MESDLRRAEDTWPQPRQLTHFTRVMGPGLGRVGQAVHTGPQQDTGEGRAWRVRPAAAPAQGMEEVPNVLFGAPGTTGSPSLAHKTQTT